MKNPFTVLKAAVKNMMEPDKPVAPEKPKEPTKDERVDLNKKKSPIPQNTKSGGVYHKPKKDRIIARNPEDVKREKNRKLERIRKQSRIKNRDH